MKTENFSSSPAIQNSNNTMKRTLLYIFISAALFYGGFSILIQKQRPNQPRLEKLPTTPSNSKFPTFDAIPNLFRGQNRTKKLEMKHNNTQFSSAGGCGLESVEWQWCSDIASKHHYSPLTEMDTKLPEALRPSWRSKNCDNLFKHRSICEQPIPHCNSHHYDLSLTSSFGNEHGPESQTKKIPLIAVLAGTTTRRVTEPHTDKIALFTLLLPSLIRSIDCGFRYMYVMGYDQGDPFYDSDQGMKEVLAWWEEQIEKPMKRNGIMITLEPVKIINHQKKPGPVFIEMARRAYSLNADYIYRVNDDTEFKGHWPKLYVRGLHSLEPPYGVIGPSSLGSNDNILTHDFVHRIHMDIFEMNYYPLELVDWWMDNWISCVYGTKRTYISKSSVVVHHTYAHGQRYEVDRSNEKYLNPAIVNGRKKIHNWMLKNNLTEQLIQQFDSDNKLKFKISDLATILK